MKTQQASTSTKRIWILATASVACVASFIALRHTTEYRRIASPDGRFYAVAEHRAYLSLIPMSPGSSSDKPGFVTVFTSDGVSCGRASLPMLQLFTDFRWRTDAAEIPLVAQWDLSQRTVHQIQ